MPAVGCKKDCRAVNHNRREGADIYRLLFTPAKLRGYTIKNRIVVPPMVTFGIGSESGEVTPAQVAHYACIAEGGAGLIITEALCVDAEARLNTKQMGIWDDRHIAGLTALAQACKKHGAVVLAQIHHAGLVAREEVSEFAYGPSPYEDVKRTRALSTAQIERIREQFTEAAQRAVRAGFDGVELHGAHAYLLSQFSSAADNRRTDEYGGTAENRTRLAREIYEGIRAVCPAEFIVGIRFGADCPELSDGMEVAACYDSCGFDYLSVSHSTRHGHKAEVPEGWFPAMSGGVVPRFHWITYAGTAVKREVSAPVMAVYDIRTPERAEYLLTGGMCDFVCIGRQMLCDPQWPNKAQNGRPIRFCLNCPRCRKFDDVRYCVIKD